MLIKLYVGHVLSIQEQRVLLCVMGDVTAGAAHKRQHLNRKLDRSSELSQEEASAQLSLGGGGGKT